MAEQALVLDNEKLRQYLASLVNMEQSKYFSDNLIKKLETEKRSLENILRAAPPAEPQKTTTQPTASGSLMGIILIAVGFILGKSAGGSGGWLIGVPLMIWGAVKLYQYFQDSKSDKARSSANYSSYNYQMNEYKKNLEKYNSEHKLASARLGIVDNMLSLAKAKLKDQESILNKYYDLNVIFPSYRGMTNVCMLYEYIASGRTHSLQQTPTDQGAYNILGQEVLMNKVILKLDDILANLQQIKYNQGTIYKSIEMANNKLDSIHSDIDSLSGRLERISENTSALNRQAGELVKTSSLNAYYQAQANKQLEYMNRMNYFSGNYGPTNSQNMPPHY